jgi:ABC-type transport system substrate-binding protein
VQTDATSTRVTLSVAGAAPVVLRVNPETAVLRDVRVREALALAIDVGAAADLLRALPQGTPAAAADGTARAYDPTAARQLLAAAGYPNGVSGLQLLVANTAPTLRLAEFLQAGWERALTVRAVLQVVTASELVTRISTTQYEVAVGR